MPGWPAVTGALPTREPWRCSLLQPARQPAWQARRGRARAGHFQNRPPPGQASQVDPKVAKPGKCLSLAFCIPFSPPLSLTHLHLH